MTRPARARIRLAALQHNFHRVREAAPGCRVMAVIKANAYGHGLSRAAAALPGADAFAVVSLEEAISLRESGCDQRIVLLEGPFSAADLRLVSGYHLDIVIHHAAQLAMLEAAPPKRPPAIWLKFNTGMHRLGFEPGAVREIATRLRAGGRSGELRLMSHLACADDTGDDYTRGQVARFEQATEGVAGERSLANSAAVLGWPGTGYDWVRPGIMLYGASPLEGRTAEELGLRPAMTLETALIAVNRHPAGARIGYGGDWTCPADMDVGVAAIGYADGYPRHAPTGMPVLVNGRPAALVGRVSMDMICIDLRGHPEAAVGDTVTLWGGELPVDEVAARAGTIAYELLSGISQRVYLDYED